MTEDIKFGPIIATVDCGDHSRLIVHTEHIEREIKQTHAQLKQAIQIIENLTKYATGGSALSEAREFLEGYLAAIKTAIRRELL